MCLNAYVAGQSSGLEVRPRDRTRLSLTSQDTAKASCLVQAAIGGADTQIRSKCHLRARSEYHFEAKAPLGLRIVAQDWWRGGRTTRNGTCRRITGRATRRPWVCTYRGAIRIIVRAQVNLRLPTAGWLTTMTVSCWLIFAVRGSVPGTCARCGGVDRGAGDQCVRSAHKKSAGVATLVAQREFGGLAADCWC